MSAVVDRCQACGTPRAGDERVCPKCGLELAASDDPGPEPSPAPPDGLAWSYRVPIIDNRYVWVRWGWAALAFGVGFAIVLGTPLVVMFAGGNGGVMFAVKLYAAIAFISGLAVVGLGVFGALSVANGVDTRFALDPQGAVATTSDDVEESVESTAMLFGASGEEPNIAAAASLLLPSSGEAKWKDIRCAQFDERSHVITLRRRWHHPLRLYVPPEHYEDAASFVRDHLPAAAALAD